MVIYAAASLKAPFTELAEQFEDQHPEADVILNFAGSSDLVVQITQGAPVDVFASADTDSMDRLAEAGLDVSSPQPFATNTLSIAVAPGNPAGIKSFHDLTDPGLQVVVCAPRVPCGVATENAEKASGTTLSPVSEENSVTDVLGKVESGQADAGLVYITDIQGAARDKVEGVDFPQAAEAVNTYPIAAVGGPDRQDLADAFVESVLSERGQAVLDQAGFGAPGD